jgi:hypothetical protein
LQERQENVVYNMVMLMVRLVEPASLLASGQIKMRKGSAGGRAKAGNGAKSQNATKQTPAALLLPCGAPDPGEPPCIRHSFLSLSAGDMQGLPERVLAPQRRLDSIGTVLRG